MAVPERVPLPVPDDRVEGVVLQQQHAARSYPGYPLGEGRRLVRRVHQPETIKNDVGWFTRRDGRQPATSQQLQPGAAVRAAVLGHPAAVRQQPRRGDPAHGIGGLGHERGRLGRPRFLGDGRVGYQLSQAA